MKWIWPIALQLIAFGVAMAETIVPSFGLLSLLCLGLIGGSWYIVIQHLPHFAIWLFALADLMLIPLGFWLGLKLMGKSPLTNRTTLTTGTGLDQEEQSLTALVDQFGTVTARLRPSGKISVGDTVYEALTAGEFLEAGTPVRIVGIKSGALQVERAQAP